MRLRLLSLGVALALAFAVFTRGAGRPPEAAKPSAPRLPVTAHGGAGASTFEMGPLPPPPARDIFRYAEPPAPAAASRSLVARGAAALPTPPAEPTPPPFPLRLVGLVHRPEGWRAAVATSAGVVLVGPGDAVSGYTVLGVDEELGLRLRGLDGVEHLLSPRS